MSLINDALKRAGQASAPANAQQPVASMHPVEYEHRTFPWVILIAVLIPVFVLAAWFLVKGWQMSRAARTHSDEVVANARTNQPQPAPAPIAVATPVPVPVPTIQTTVVVQVRPAEPPKPSFPIMKLQGIFWRPARPSAVINSKTVYKGDRVDSARVLAIDQESVTVQWQTETKVLTLQ